MKRLTALRLLCIILTLLLPLGVHADTAVYHAEEIGSKRIALTFDDGPHPHLTKEILRVLKEYDVRATFFEIGKNVKSYPDAAKEVAQAGHEIGNHTFSHRCVKQLGERELDREIRDCENVIREITGVSPVLFRPPGGLYAETVNIYCENTGYYVILWSIDTRDWAHRSPDHIVSEVLEHVKPGDIILMHDYIGTDSPTVETLQRLIPELKKRGYEFCTVSELLSHE